MKKFIFILACIVALCVPQNTLSQDKLDIGLFGGASFYMGDLNMNKIFVYTRPAIGGIVRYNFTDRLAAKADAIVGWIAGEYPTKNHDLYIGYPNEYEFSRAIVDLSVTGEFNFRSYDHMFDKKHSRWTPYVTLGLGGTFYKRYTEDVVENLEDKEKNKTKQVFILSLPFGIGAKFKVNDWLRLGVEWTFHKTFADDLDYVGREIGDIDTRDPYNFNVTTRWHNNDWYSFLGVMVTFSMWPRRLECNDGLRNFNN